jgi:phage/plasmid-associated DNA primase
MNNFLTHKIKKMIIADVCSEFIAARINHSQISAYLKTMFEGTYLTYNVTKKETYWYEFVTDMSVDIKKGELFKWRELGSYPDSLVLYITTNLRFVIEEIHGEIKAVLSELEQAKNEDNKHILEYIKHIYKAYNNSSIKICNGQFQTSVIKQVASSFKQNSFIDEMDKNPNILGVGNGLIEFDREKYTLITQYHSYAISMYTPINFTPYNDKSKYVNVVYNVIKAMFPDEEQDAFNFILYYLSTSLDGNLKESIFLIITGGGGNGKTVLLEFFRATLGEKYIRKMPLSYITDQKRTSSASADPVTMELKNARLVNFSESDKNEKLNISRVKEITGHETLSARGLYRDQENFKPNSNYIVTTNHHFALETTENSVWRRMLTYEFKMTFKKNHNKNNRFERERDSEIINLMMKDDRYKEAFLSILVDYHSKLYSEYGGDIYNVPKSSINAETEMYRQKEDIIQRFISLRVYYYEGYAQPLDELIGEYRNYYKVENSETLRLKAEDIKGLFKNSVLEKFIKQDSDTGMYKLHNFFARSYEDEPIAGSITYGAWISQANK